MFHWIVIWQGISLLVWIAALVIYARFDNPSAYSSSWEPSNGWIFNLIMYFPLIIPALGLIGLAKIKNFKSPSKAALIALEVIVLIISAAILVFSLWPY